MARFGSERRHQLGQMVCGVTRGGAGDANIGEQLKQPTRCRWRGDPLPLPHRGAQAGLVGCYITEGEGLRRLICPGDPQVIAVVMETCNLLHMDMEMKR